MLEKEKKPKTAKELSSIAKKAVATRREKYPEWGQKKRDKEAQKKEKQNE